jgi:hypothetical protein
MLRLSAVCLAFTLSLQAGHGQRSRDEAASFLDRKERWAIKTGADPEAHRIRLTTARVARVADLIHLPRPAALPENASTRAARTTRYGAAEHTLYTIDADIVRYKLEKDDHDYHVVIRDHADTHAEDAPAESGRRRTMIVEFPDPAVVVPSSRWRTAIAAARRDFTDSLNPQPRFTYQVIHAQITGVGFFDFLHGQSGVAPNGIELHPVLKVAFLEDIRTTTSAPVPQQVRRQTARTHRSSNSSGQVWVNLNSGVYWRPGSDHYGTTRRGQYMPEKDAIRAGYRAAKGQ